MKKEKLKSICKEKWYKKYTWLSFLLSFVFHNKFIKFITFICISQQIYHEINVTNLLWNKCKQSK